jgi:hypothetical protein
MIFRLSFGIGAAALLAAAAHGQTTEEYRVKAAFLYNFAKFVEWPSQAFKGPADPIAICIVGKDPFGAALTQAVNGKSIEGKPFCIRIVSDAQQVSGCHILFVGGSEKKLQRPILEASHRISILTVGETEAFLADGGIVSFKIEAGRVRLQVSIDAAEQAGLSISSKLLSLAEIVGKRK